MSSFYDLASLVMIPSGKKAGKVYSQKPLTTDGQLDFTRASTATRIGSDGKIEKTRTNLLLQSNSFVTSWGGNQSSMTSGQAGYDGTNNANLHNASGGYSYRSQTGTFSGVNTFSIYAKAGTAPCIRLYTTGSISLYANFDLSAGSIIDNQGIDAKMVSVGSGWYRCSFTFTASNNTIYYYCADSGGNVATVTSGDNILVQNAQVEPGLVATDYIATTTAAVSVGSVDNMPRLNYTPGSATSCPSLLLEPQRTNVLPQSEYFSGSDWTKSNATTTNNIVISPDNSLNGSKLIEDSSNSTHRISDTIVVSGSGVVYTQSIFAKSGGSGRYLRIFRGSGTYNFAVFDLENGTVFAQGGSNIISTKIENYGNGWYRCSSTYTTQFSNIGTYYGLQNGSSDSYTGDGSSFIYIYGAQLEEGSYATSYIPTFGATVTRVADTSEKTGISSLIGQTEGTLFCEVDVIAASPNYHTILQVYGDGNNRVAIGQNINSTDLFFFLKSAGSSTLVINTNSTGRFKIALAYKSGDNVLYINGVSALTSSRTFSFATTLDRLYLNNVAGSEIGIFNDHKSLLFTSRLSNTQLAELTSLDS